VETSLKVALINAVVVGSGGFLGALARYGLSGLVQRQVTVATFPYGTLIVNLLGCLAIGVLAGLADSRQLFGPEFRVFALIGLLGGFTTFSTFGYETFAMVRDAEYVRAATNVGVQVIGGLALVWLGYTIAAWR
jgi:CrcB protein